MKQFLKVISVALCVLVGGAGCTSQHPQGNEGAVVGTYTGPWADEFERMAAEGNPFVLSVLADSELSDAEAQEGLAVIEDCYRSHNATVTYDKYGFETVESLDGKSDPMEVMSACAFADGGIWVLYDQMSKNPENQNQESLIVACLIREGLVEPGFTVEEFAENFETEHFTWDRKDEKSKNCFRDPLGTVQ